MAFASIAATNGGNSGAGATDHTVNLPASIASGNLLLVFFYNHDSAGTTTVSMSGYTEMFTQAFTAASVTRRFTVLYRLADGTEGATATATTATSVGSAHATYRITGWYGTISSGVNWATPATTTSGTTIDCPNLDPADWATEDTLWIACCGWGADVAFSSYPTDYTLSQTTNRWANSGGGGVAVAGREVAAASENPGVFTTNLSIGKAANTIAIRPAAAGGLASKLHGLLGGKLIGKAA